MAPLTGRTALVTGASRGIGESVARALGAAGATVALLARTRSALDEIAREIGNGAIAVTCDLSDQASVALATAEVERAFGGAPDIVVNNAGLFEIRKIEDTAPGQFATIVATNLVAPFFVVRAFLPGMRSRRSGHVVTIGSIADRHIFAGNAAYSATKFGGRAVHEVLRAETRGTGVRATLVSPAAVDTEIWETIDFLDTDNRPDRASMLPPDAVAHAVLYALTQPAEVNIDELRLSRA